MIQTDIEIAKKSLDKALLAMAQGEMVDARNWLEQAAEEAPQSALPDFYTALSYSNSGMLFSAVPHFLKALQKDPEQSHIRQNFVHCIYQMNYYFEGLYSDQLEAELIRTFDGVSIDPQHLFSLACSIVMRKSTLDVPIENQPLFLKLLEKTLLTDLDLEQKSCLIRQRLLEHFVSEESALPSREQLELIQAFAIQAINNEYLWSISEKEAHLLQGLQQRIAYYLNALKPRGNEKLAIGMLLWGMYEPLSRLKGIQQLREQDWLQLPHIADRLLARWYFEPQREKQLQQQIERATATATIESKAIQEHYQAFPYPRWLGIQPPQAMTFDQWKKKYFPALYSTLPSTDHPAILVAGCGTGKHAISTALEHPTSQVLAIDLSTTSLAYAMRKTEELGLNNITFRQGDILELDTWTERFDIIECVGTLHHLVNPMEGWYHLRRLLTPGGLMKIGLYSKSARRPIEWVKQKFDLNKLAQSYSGIRGFREHLIGQKTEKQIAAVLGFLECYAFNPFQDLLFHPQEYCYSISEISTCLEKLDLSFLGFILKPSILNDFLEQHPQAGAMKDLILWDQYEQKHPDTFLNMYQFWCQ